MDYRKLHWNNYIEQDHMSKKYYSLISGVDITNGIDPEKYLDKYRKSNLTDNQTDKNKN